MRATLTQVEGGHPHLTIALSGADLEIGRERGAGLRIEREKVSRRHARIHQESGHHVLSDLGSANGTFVNGRLLDGPVVLQHGDVIDLAGEVHFVYRTARARRARWFAAVSACLVIAALTWRVADVTRKPDPAWVDALALAREGISAERAGELSVARSRLKSAAGVLYREGKLDDVERARVMSVAMERIGERLEEDLDLPSLFEQVLEATRPAPPSLPEGSVRAGCALDRVDAARVAPCIEAHVHSLFIELRQPTEEIPDYFYLEVGQRLLVERDFLESALRRGTPIIPLLERALAEKRMPPLLHYVALIESAYRPTARSRKGAVGIWQLMPPTARDHGLTVRSGLDERTDIEKSSQAAAQYLQHLLFEFGSDALLLALAGYNLGQGQVRARLKQLEDPFSDRSYWRLVETGLLPHETAVYVTRFVAAAIAGEGGLPSRSVLIAAGY